MSESVSKLDLSEIIEALAPLEDKYFELGIQLKLEPELLKSIEINYSSASRRLHETIVLWRRNEDNSNLRWSTLASAVERMRVYPKLAEELQTREHRGTNQMQTIPTKKRRYSNAFTVSKSCDHQQEFSSGYGSRSDSLSGSETESYFDCVPGCGCGKCSIYMVVAGKCPHPSAKKVPCILTRRRSQSAIRSELLIEDDDGIEYYEEMTRGIQIEFGKYVTNGCRSLKDRGVSIHELTLFLESASPLMKAVSDKLDGATCIEQVLKIAVKQACSWFDYELVKEIIHFFCNDNQLTEAYETRFKKYAEQRLPKRVKHIEVGGRNGGKQLLIKIDKEWDKISFNDLIKLRGRFASILGVLSSDLYLADIREGCIMMTFMITEELAGRLFSKRNSTTTSSKLSSFFTASKIKSLKEEGVILFTCGKFSWRCVTEQKEPELKCSECSATDLTDQVGNSESSYQPSCDKIESVKEPLGKRDQCIHEVSPRKSKIEQFLDACPLPIFSLSFYLSMDNLGIPQNLTEKYNVNPNIENERGETALHLACKNGHWKIAEYLVKSPHFDPNCQYRDGSTPFHLLCRYEQQRAVEYLVKHPNFDPTCHQLEDGSTCLHLTCGNGWISIAKILVEKYSVDPVVQNNRGQTAIHKAFRSGHWNIGMYLLLVASNHQDSDDSSPFPLICRDDQQSICLAEVILEKFNVDPNYKNEKGQTTLHKACQQGYLEIVKVLVNSDECNLEAADNRGRTPLHWAVWHGYQEIVKVLVNSDECNLEAADNRGWTPLHWAVWLGHTAVAALLLQEGQCNPNCVTHDGRTPLDMTNKPELIRLLLIGGAKPTSIIPSHLRDNPTDMAIKMFILGNPGAGKSTFVKALSTEGRGFYRIKHQFTKVRDVDEKTAGIIPHDIHSKALGRLTLYDFAGHKEYYAGHDALLHNTMTNSPSIVTLVVDVRDEEDKIRETLLYWFQFINNHSSEGGAKPHLLIIGSHADEIPSSQAKQRSRVLESAVNSYKFENVSFAGQIITDCRYAESSPMTKLRSMLSHICQSLRSSEKMEIAHHSFLVFLLHRYKYKLAITYGSATEELRRKVNSDEESYAYLGYVSKSFNHFEICEKLNERGHILFMKNKEHPENSWIVLDKAVLLSQVNGVIFAPEGFKEHQKSLSTSTGVVPLSKLAPLFPNINPDMITQFLCHLEFCQEIKELKLASLLATEGQSSPTAGERYFFFPGLVHLDTPRDIIESTASKLDYNSGWVLQCSKSEQFFSNRFLQVLLLRLAFMFALAPTDSSTTDHLSLHRKCSVWKNGIYWVNRSGGEAIVEIIDLRQVVVIVRSELEKMELVRLRSSVINTVINTEEEFCSKVLARESLILFEDAAAVYPLDPSKVTGVSITEVAATIIEGKKFAINEKNQRVQLEKLIYFEPYAYLGKPLLQQLFSDDGTEAQEITDEILTDIAAKGSHQRTNEYCTIFEQDVDACASHEGVCGLLQVFQLWRDKMGKEGTRKNFKKKLDQFSVFAGRNPLKLITASSSTNPTGHVDQYSSQYHESDSAAVNSTAHGGETESREDYRDRNSVIPKIGDQPQLHELQLLEGVDGRTVRVMERVAPDWKRLAISLKFNSSIIKIIEKDNKTSTEEACQEMFARWLAGEHDLAQPCTWDTLINCLRRAAFIYLANSLRTSLRQ